MHIQKEHGQTNVHVHLNMNTHVSRFILDECKTVKVIEIIKQVFKNLN